MPPDEVGEWRWELVITPLRRWTVARTLLADAAHDRLCSISEWLGTRRSRVADRAQDLTVNLEIRLAAFTHTHHRNADGVRLPITDEHARTLHPEAVRETPFSRGR